MYRSDSPPQEREPESDQAVPASTCIPTSVPFTPLPLGDASPNATVPPHILPTSPASANISPPCAEGTLHRAKPCFMSCFATRFMHRKMRFIEKSTCVSQVLFLSSSGTRIETQPILTSSTTSPPLLPSLLSPSGTRTRI